MESCGNEKFKQPIYNEPMIVVLDAKETDGDEGAALLLTRIIRCKKN